ncbi:unnamed protein product [Chironomus riparius]|uniref:G-protein coupled receptors family 1 profile domain-containing protein n=1 Tax=Chironomus riparius TaxID=315576 RepID=A0A9N9WUM4_9DIPT|nr:unnamed protein product [Chironomus riparius]
MMDYVISLNTIASSSYIDEDSASLIITDQNSNTLSRFDESFRLNNYTSMEDELGVMSYGPDSVNNLSTMSNHTKHDAGYRDSLSIILPITICYLIIFIAGVLGNVITCIVIAKNKTMHTATNYYLFNLAVSDFLVLMFGMPPDLYNIWFPGSYPFSEIVCILQGLFSETSCNATILTITSFTCERYIAICHPFRSHTMSKLSRVVKFIFIIWVLAFGLALPQALQFGTISFRNGEIVSCTVKNQFFEHSFELSSFLFFIVPMTIICVLYILIGLKLRKSKLLYDNKGKGCDSQRCIKGQTRVVRMLIAVVVSFFLCFAPFHSQRIMAIYGKIMKKSSSLDDTFMKVYVALTYMSGITYFLSTCINPFLYNLMSHKFRNASKLTLFVHCLSRTPSTRKSQLGSNYSALTLKFGPLDPTRVANVNRDHFIIQSGNNSGSEIIEIKEVSSIDEIRNFRTDGIPYLMEQPYHAVVRFEPINFSYSQQTTSTTISRTGSLKSQHNQNESRFNSFARKLKKCTQKAFIIKSYGDDEKVPNGYRIPQISAIQSLEPSVIEKNSSLREVDEEFMNAELHLEHNNDDGNIIKQCNDSNPS